MSKIIWRDKCIVPSALVLPLVKDYTLHSVYIQNSKKQQQNSSLLFNPNRDGIQIYGSELQEKRIMEKFLITMLAKLSSNFRRVTLLK